MIPSPVWSRRTWLFQTSRSTAVFALARRLAARSTVPSIQSSAAQPRAWGDVPSACVIPPGPMQALALKGIDAAKSAGAQYADVRVTRVVQHGYRCIGDYFDSDVELVAVGVRALVNGYWGFAASPFQTDDEVVQLARNAVTQAQTNAKDSAQPIELGTIPVVTGTWSTPVRIDPFHVTIEEKRDYITYWKSLAAQHHVPFYEDGFGSVLEFARQERVLATSEGSLVTQITYESAGDIKCGLGGTGGGPFGRVPSAQVAGLQRSGKGWELFLDAKLPDQFVAMEEEARHPAPSPSAKLALVGRYTVVCDGATMASMLDQTLGIATQLDRALGYEANAGGTSFLDDPLDMLGQLKIASPLVTITANRSAPAQLATVKWDDEGVEPPDFTLVKDGVLTDFQTTREQAGWLAPYYQKQGRPVRSNGCAAAETALSITMQHMPNLAMAPSPSNLGVNDLVANVSNGVLIEDGSATSDWQARGGLLMGSMRQIRNGRLGPVLRDGAILFDTTDFWKKVTVVGGASTVGGIDVTQYDLVPLEVKGQPEQAVSHSVRAVAAVIENQPMVNPSRKA